MLTVRVRFAFLLLFVSSPLLASVTIDKIEVNQAIGVQKDGHLNFVAGKDAVIRAFLSEAVTIDSKTSATIRRDGKVVATIGPITHDEAANVVDFLCPTRATCGSWAAGSYQFD